MKAKERVDVRGPPRLGAAGVGDGGVGVVCAALDKDPGCLWIWRHRRSRA